MIPIDGGDSTISRLWVGSNASSIEMFVRGSVRIDEGGVLTATRVDGTTQHVPLMRDTRVEIEAVPE